MEHPKTNKISILVEGDTDTTQVVEVSHEPATMIELPEHLRAELPESSARVVGREVVSRAQNTGRFNNGIVASKKTDGIPIDFAGIDALTAQARRFDGGDTRQRETSMTPEEIESV